MKTRPRLPKLAIGHLWALTSLAAILILLNTHPIRPHDFWWHLQAGRELVTNGHIPTGDSLAFTVPGKPYANYATFWLMEAVFYLIYRSVGPVWLVLAHSLAITAGGTVLLYLCWRTSHNWRMAGLAVLFYFGLAFHNWNLRPQSIAFLLGPIYLLAVYASRWRFRPWLLAVFPGVMVIWVNSHGSFFIGLLMAGVWVADELWQILWLRMGGQRVPLKRLAVSLLVVMLSSAACLVNPRGIGMIAYVQELAGNPVVRGLVPEWAPPSLTTQAGVMFLGGLLFCAVLLAVSPRRPGFFELATFVCFALLGLSASRAGAWFGMSMAPIVAFHLTAVSPLAGVTQRQASTSGEHAQASGALLPAEETRDEPTFRLPAPSPNRTVLNYVFVALLVVVSALSLPWLKHFLPLPEFKQALVSPETPVDATRFLLREDLPGPMFNNLAFGSYLIWAAQPKYPVFIDPRLELYPLEVVRDYLNISAAAEGWEKKLDEYHINILFLSPEEQQGLVEAARRSPNWRMIYADRSAAVFVRRVA